MALDFGKLVAQKKPIVVALSAYALPDDHRVWKSSPGKTYRFYNVVREAEVVFPDVRGLGEYFDAGADWDENEVLDIIAADRWYRELESRERGNKHRPGSRAINSTDRANYTYLSRLFFEARKGDFVVIPAEGYDKEVLFGEFLTDPSHLRAVDATDGEYSGRYVGRPVKWRRYVTKRELKTELIDELHYRAAVFVLSKSRAEDVYREVLGNFVFQGRYVAEFRTEKEKFTAEDFAVVSTWLNGFDFIRHHMEETRGALPDKSFAEMGLERVPDNEAAEIRVDIQSPGEIFAKSFGPFALVLMALVPLAGCSASDVIDNGVAIEMNQVGGATDECRLKVQQSVNDMVRVMSYHRLDDANCLMQRAKDDAKIRTDARLKSAPEERK